MLANYKKVQLIQTLISDAVTLCLLVLQLSFINTYALKGYAMLYVYKLMEPLLRLARVHLLVSISK